jgi:hypothetical protein
VREGLILMFTWKRSIIITSRNPEGRNDPTDPQIEVFKGRVGRFFEGLAKGALVIALYGSGTLVLSGVFFFFSWKLGVTALLVLSGLLPLSASAYLLWRLRRRGHQPRPWRSRSREAAILKLARRLGGRLTVADVALGTSLTLQESEAVLNDLVRKGYAELQVSPSGVLVYHGISLADVPDKNRAEGIFAAVD